MSTVVYAFLLSIVVGLVVSLLSGVFVMIAAHFIHVYAISSFPAFGYGASIALAYALSVVGTIMRGYGSLSKD